jgi:membrane protein YdbS with pleckstrin-like domain
MENTAAEKTILDGRIPFKVFHGSHGLLWLILLGWNIGLLISLFQSLSWRIRITSQRVVLTHGLLSQSEEEVEFYRVRDTKLQQGSIQRMFGVATITLISDDVTAPELTFSLHDPQHYREQMRQFIRQQRLELIAIQVD